MEKPVSHLGDIVIAVLAVILCAALVTTVVNKTSSKIDTELDQLDGITNVTP